MDIGTRLAELRKKHHLKQLDIAIKINESQQVVSNIERGITMPDIEQLKRIADIYNMSLDRLVGRKFVGETPNDIERQIISYVEQMDEAGKELSLGLLSQVAQHRGNSDGNE